MKVSKLLTGILPTLKLFMKVSKLLTGIFTNIKVAFE
jgi:hypothetical protein